MFYNDITVSCRAVNGLKPGALTAITAPPAASSPGLVPFAVWLQLQKGKNMLMRQICHCPRLSCSFVPTAVFMGPYLCVFRCVGGVRSLACVNLMPHLLSIHLSCEGQSLKKQLCNQLDFDCEFYHYFHLPAITSGQVCALTSSAVFTGLGWHTWIIPPKTDVWIRACSWCFKGFKGVFVSL